MCNFFSCIATRDGRLLFTELDSHHEIIRRAELCDTQQYLRSFVRLEAPWDYENQCFTDVLVDEVTSTPSWFEEDQQLWEDRALALANRVVHPHLVYSETLQEQYTAHIHYLNDKQNQYVRILAKLRERLKKGILTLDQQASKRGIVTGIYDNLITHRKVAYTEAEEAVTDAFVAAIQTFEGYVPSKKKYAHVSFVLPY